MLLTCLRGAFPPVDLRAVCLVLAILDHAVSGAEKSVTDTSTMQLAFAIDVILLSSPIPVSSGLVAGSRRVMVWIVRALLLTLLALLLRTLNVLLLHCFLQVIAILCRICELARGQPVMAR